MKATDKQFRNRRVKQIETMCEKYNVDFDLHIAQTGTHYFTIAEKTVRVSDHADAYATADFNCDPYDSDMYNSVKKHIQANGFVSAIDQFGKQKCEEIMRTINKEHSTMMGNIFIYWAEGNEGFIRSKYADKLTPEQFDANLETVKSYLQ